MTFTKTPPTAPGFYAWRAGDDDSSVTLAQIEQDGEYLGVFFAGGSLGYTLSKVGGEWCELVPSEYDGHSGDCTIYSHPSNGGPFDGVCTCGYGWQQVRKCDWEHMVSAERKEHEAMRFQTAVAMTNKLAEKDREIERLREEVKKAFNEAWLFAAPHESCGISWELSRAKRVAEGEE